MGYTHYWYRPEELPADEWEAFAENAKKLLAKSPAQLAGGWGDPGTKPTVDLFTVRFNGKEPESYETFAIERVEKKNPWREDKPDVFRFCKTQYRPYDVVVCAMLQLARHHFGDKFKVSSDGGAEGQEEGAKLLLKVTGIKAKRPLVKEEE